MKMENGFFIRAGACYKLNRVESFKKDEVDGKPVIVLRMYSGSAWTQHYSCKEDREDDFQILKKAILESGKELG